MTANTKFLEIAIWEFCSDRELKPLDDLFRRKYFWLKKLRETDLFALTGEEAERTHKRTAALEQEVATLYSAKNMICRLHELYMNVTADIGEAIYHERLDLLNQVMYWKSRFQQEHAECMREKQEVLNWVELALKFSSDARAR